LNVPIAHHIFPGKYCEAIKLHFFVESSHRLPNLDLQHNGFELTCGAVSMRARFAHDSKLLLIYKMHFQTADCLNMRARACRAGRLSELLGNAARDHHLVEE
jgi:hypothetical protein